MSYVETSKQFLVDRSTRLEQLLLTSLAAATLALILYQIFFLGIRIPRDSGAFLTIASGVLHGSIPYVDLVDHKPPGIYYTLAAALAIDHSVTAARSLLYLTNAGTAVLLILAGRRVSSLRTGLLAACLYIIGLTIYQGLWILTEQFVVFWSVLGLLAAVHATDTDNSRADLVAGLAAGIAVLYKQTGLLTVIGLLGYFAVQRIDTRQIARYGLGFTIPIAVTMFYFATQNALDSFIYWTILANQSYTPTGLTTTLETIHLKLDSAPILWTAAAGGLISSFYWRTTSLRLLTSILFVLALIPLLIRQYGHYFIQPLPFAVLLAALFLDDLAEILTHRVPEAIPLQLSWLGVFAMFLVLTAPTINGAANAHHRVEGFSLDDQQTIAADVTSYSEPDEQMLVVTAEPQYYFLANRQPFGRNVYYIAINQGESFTPASVIEQLESQPPSVVVLRGCSRSPKICDAVKRHYKKQGEYARGISVWTKR